MAPAPPPYLAVPSASSLVPDNPHAPTFQSKRRAPGSTPRSLYGASAPDFHQSGRSAFAVKDTVKGQKLMQRAIQARALQQESSTHHSARRSLAPNSTQKVTLGVIGAYVGLIAILWNIPYVKYVLWPWKMLTIAFHEFGHAATGCCTGAKIKSITLDPREGGCTMMAGGWGPLTLCAGYLGSSFIGAALIACGFNIVASKVCSFVLAGGFLITLWWSRRDWLTIVTILFAVGLLIACWFIAHGAALRFYVLFMGTMSSLYSVWDIFDDLILRKVNESDASVFAKRYGGSSACWGVIWAIISLAFMACGILIGLAAFKESFSEQAADSKDFLPTRMMMAMLTRA